MEPAQNQPVNPNQQPLPPVPERPAEALSPAEQPTAPEVQPAVPAAPEPTNQAMPVAPPVMPPAAASQASPPPPPASPALPVAPPSIAGDVDVIEKEWVDTANQIIEQTKDDPYKEEEAVEALQQDYLKKRYGHDVKKPDDA